MEEDFGWILGSSGDVFGVLVVEVFKDVGGWTGLVILTENPRGDRGAGWKRSILV